MCLSPQFGPASGRDEMMVVEKGSVWVEGGGLFSVPGGSGAQVSTQASERGSVYSQRGTEGGFMTKNTPLNTVISKRLGS